jgi:SPP1 gp7 family putative phage head morphogenesis protein
MSLIDIDTRHQHYLERYKTGLVNRLGKILSQIEDIVILSLSKAESHRSQARIKEIINKITDGAEKIFNDYSDTLNGELNDFTLQEMEFIAGALKRAITDESYTLPSINRIKSAINARPFSNLLLADEIADFSASQVKLIKNTVTRGFIEGLKNQKIIDLIIGSEEFGYKDGVMNLTRTKAGRLVRTAVQHIAAVTRHEVYNSVDVIEKYVWLSTLDGRTSAICRARDGLAYPLNKGPLPPAHPNCRSVTSALLEEKAETDENGNEVLSDHESYSDWLRKQSKEFQDDILGEDRAELFRKGELTLQKFVDESGRELTLEQLKATYPTAWAKIQN